jgi:hypothetical protein
MKPPINKRLLFDKKTLIADRNFKVRTKWKPAVADYPHPPGVSRKLFPLA